MSSLLVRSCFFLSLMHTIAPAHAAWEKLAPLVEPAGGLMAGAVNGKILVAGGTNWRDDVKRWLDTVWLFDPAAGRWTTGPRLPHAVAYAAFASDGNILCFAGGADGQQGRKEVFALDEHFKLTLLGELSQPVVFSGSALHDGRLCIFGGTPDPDDWSKGTNALLEVNLADGSTKALAPLKLLPGGIGIPAVVSMPSGLHTFTGAWLEDKATAHNVAGSFIHDPAQNLWRAITPFPAAIRGLAAVALDEHRIYLAGGYGTDAEGFLASAHLYDTRTGRYTTAPPLPLAANTTLVKCGEFIYLLGGEDQKKHRTDACWRIRITELLGEK